MTKRIFICAGEASGDLLAADLAKAVLAKHPDYNLVGMGGKQMEAAGVEIVLDAEPLAVVGLWEIVTHLRAIHSAIRLIKSKLLSNPPDLLILVDYPGFNLRIAKIAHQAGIKVMFYVSPQIWAWRYGRIKKIKRYVDHMAVLFDFEKCIYEKETVPVSFVGHPLCDIVKPTLPIPDSYAYFQLNPKQPVIAFFPGSRHNEIERLLPIMIQAIPLIQKQLPDAQFVLPRASTIPMATLEPYIKNTPIKITHDHTYDLLAITDAAIVASGTATLEIALSKVPFLMIYKLAKLTAMLARFIVKLKYVALCNIISDKLIAKEYLQEDVTPERIASEAVELIKNQPYRQHMIDELTTVRTKLGDCHASAKAAAVALEMLE